MNTELSRPWFAHYDSFVPRTSELWNKPLYALLDEAYSGLFHTSEVRGTKES